MRNISVKKSVDFYFKSSRNLHRAIPSKPPSNTIVDKSKLPPKTRIDSSTIQHLERVSLVDFANVEGIERLEAAITLADVIRTVDTAGVEPMYSVLENQTLFLRDDVAEEPNSRREMIKLATVSEEDYFVSPQGNVPLDQTAQKYHLIREKEENVNPSN